MRPRISLLLTVLLTLLIALSAEAAAVTADATAVDYAIELGITPESLVVSDISTQEATTMLGLIDAATQQQQAIATAHADCDSAAAALRTARAALRDDPTDPTLQQQYQDAWNGFQNALQQLDAAQAALRATATGELSQAQLDALAIARQAVCYDVPGSFIVLDRNQQEWHQVEVALRAEARSIRTGEQLDPDYEQLLSTIRSDAQVQLAQQRLDSNLASMQTLFDSQ